MSVPIDFRMILFLCLSLPFGVVKILQPIILQLGFGRKRGRKSELVDTLRSQK